MAPIPYRQRDADGFPVPEHPDGSDVPRWRPTTGLTEHSSHSVYFTLEPEATPCWGTRPSGSECGTYTTDPLGLCSVCRSRKDLEPPPAGVTESAPPIAARWGVAC